MWKWLAALLKKPKPRDIVAQLVNAEGDPMAQMLLLTGQSQVIEYQTKYVRGGGVAEHGPVTWGPHNLPAGATVTVDPANTSRAVVRSAAVPGVGVIRAKATDGAGVEREATCDLTVAAGEVTADLVPLGTPIDL